MEIDEAKRLTILNAIQWSERDWSADLASLEQFIDDSKYVEICPQRTDRKIPGPMGSGPPSGIGRGWTKPEKRP